MKDEESKQKYKNNMYNAHWLSENIALAIAGNNCIVYIPYTKWQCSNP